MAEWFRSKHAKRSETIIENPWERAGISSPRTELMPARMYRLLGQVCEMHGRRFDDLLGPEGLKFREVGIATDDCHPRLVACLLRMGDLLDIDDNRFCPVMQRIVGYKRPQLTVAHEEKHSAIRHFRLDRDRIEVTAVCQTMEGYVETVKWFDWLKEEAKQQMLNWEQITPNRDLGLLPTLGDINVELLGQLQVFQPGVRPQLSIDEKVISELLQGRNFYSFEYSCVRELLQNAIDASLIRIFLENRNSITTEKPNPIDSNIQKFLANFSIDFSIRELGLENNSQRRWRITIIDQGCGLQWNDLEFLLRMGSSHGNINRQRIIDTMPEWMKPSGTFGIGFRSVFEITDQVTLVSKNIFTSEIFEVILHNPSGPNNGLVTVKKRERDFSKSFGTTISFEFTAERYASSWTIALGDNKSLSARLLSQTDPILNDDFPFQIMQLADQVNKFSQGAIIAVGGSIQLSDGLVQVIGASKDAVSKRRNFVASEGNELFIEYRPTGIQPAREIEASYRGQHFEAGLNAAFPHVFVTIDLLSGKASEWLTANREKLIHSAGQNLSKVVNDALYLQIASDLKKGSEIFRPELSFFLASMVDSEGNRWQRLLLEYLEYEWQKLTPINSGTTFQDYLNKSEFILGEKNSFSTFFGEELCDIIIPGFPNCKTIDVLGDAWIGKGGSVQLISEEEIPGIEAAKREVAVERGFSQHKLFQFSSNPQPLYSKNALAQALHAESQPQSLSRRILLRCDEEWSALFLKNEISVRAYSLFKVAPKHSSGNVILPMLFRGRSGPNNIGLVESTSEQLLQLSEWAQPRLRSRHSVEEIRRYYQDFMTYLDEEIMANSKYAETWIRSRKKS